MSRSFAGQRRTGASAVRRVDSDDDDDSHPDLTDDSSNAGSNHDDDTNSSSEDGLFPGESSAAAERAAREKAARERRAREAREDAEEEERRRRRKEKIQQYQQETTATSSQRPSSARHSSVGSLSLQPTSSASVDGLVDAASLAGSPFVLIPSALQPLVVTPALSYLGSTTALSSSASTPIPSHPSLGPPMVHCSQELVFADDSACELACVTFRNYYVGRLTVKQMVAKEVAGDREGRSKQVWTTILHRAQLMHRPHEEGEAQRVVTLHVRQFHAAKFQPENLYRLRFDYEQPSPNWKSCYLTDVQCWRLATTAAGSSSGGGESSRRSARGTQPGGANHSRGGASSARSGGDSVEDLLAAFGSTPASSAVIASKLASPSLRQRIEDIAHSLAITD